eukprot:1467323-Prorocentrum_lima.AAC.1
MTSSLVGSEMCIRDSNRPSSLDCLGPSTLSLKFLGWRSAESRVVASRACLLYTSDAADDM